MAHGYIFRFKGDNFDKYEISNPHLVKIDQYSLDGTFIKTYNSRKEAENKYNCNLSAVLNGRCNSCAGFYWCKHGENFIIPTDKRFNQNK